EQLDDNTRAFLHPGSLGRDRRLGDVPLEIGERRGALALNGTLDPLVHVLPPGQDRPDCTTSSLPTPGLLPLSRMRGTTGRALERERDVVANGMALGQRLGRTFRERGHRLYLVGGPVRDQLLGRPTHDLDFATDAVPEETRRALQAAG